MEPTPLALLINSFPIFSNANVIFRIVRLFCAALLLSATFVVAAQDYLDYIFADFKIDNRIISSELELVTRDYRDFYLALTSFNEHLACTLKLDSDARLLSGDFWGQTISLNLEAQAFLVDEDDVYLNINVLTYFPLEYEFNHAKQWLSIFTDGKHPKTQEIIREQRKNLIEAIKERQKEVLVKSDRYEIFTPPNLDINLGIKNKDKLEQAMYAQATGDFLFHQGSIQISTSSNQKPHGRAIFARKLDVGLTPMSYEFGDIKIPQSAFIPTVSSGLGFYIGQDARRSQKLRDNVNGYTLPGSEIELHQGDYLVDFTVADESGYYELGKLDFRRSETSYFIKIIAPDGKTTRQEIKKPTWKGLKVGQWSPEFVYMDAGAYVLNKTRSTRDDRFAMIGSSYVFDEEQLVRGGVEWHKTSSGTYNVPFVDYEFISQDGSELSSKIGFADAWLHENRLKWVVNSAHSLDLQIARSKAYDNIQNRKTLGYYFTDDKRRFQSVYSYSSGMGVTEKSVISQLGLSDVDKSFLLTWDKKIVSQSADRVTLVTSASGTWGAVNLSLTREFQQQHQDYLSLSYSKLINGYSFSASTSYSTRQSKVATYMRLSKSWGKLSSSFSISKSESQPLIVGLNIAFSFNAKAPFETLNSRSYRNGATIKNWAFLDGNYNGKWDEELNEQTIPGVRLEARSSVTADIEIDERSHLFGVDAYDPSLFQVNSEQVDNPFLIPLYPSIQVESHPGGRVDVAIPLQLFYEAEGEIILLDKTGQASRHTGYVALELVDLDSKSAPVRVAYTEKDGFYIIDKIKRGRYTLRVSKEYLDENNITCSPCEYSIDTQSADDFIMYVSDIVLRAREVNSNEE